MQMNEKNLMRNFRQSELHGKLKKIRTASFVQETIRGFNEQIKKDGTQNTLLSLLIAGKDNCCLQEEPQPIQPKPSKPADIFKDDEALKAQEEENRRKREEEEKRKKEEEKRKKEEERRKKEQAKKNKPSWFKSKIDTLTKELFDDDKM